jgi:hypothetical protein
MNTQAPTSRDALSLAGRVGLVARTVFYLLLAYLVLRIALLHNAPSRQADANGALSLVARDTAGRIVVITAAAGFVLFGLARLRAAWSDTRASGATRVTTALQGLASIAAAAVPASYARGRTSAGSEQQSKHSATELLGFPGGQVLLLLLGALVLGWCGWQIRTAWQQDYTDGLALEGQPRWIRRMVTGVGQVGLVARALVIAPLGIFLIVAASTYDAHHVRGLDGELLLLDKHPWGRAVLAIIALGLLNFAAYAAVEARFRRVESQAG